MVADEMVAAGRIIAASLQSFETCCFTHGLAPPLGSLVVTMDADPPVYGIVAEISTQGADPSRPIAPHGAPDEELAAVLSRNPQLTLLLQTRFTSFIAGHGRGAALRQLPPDLPPPLIARVRTCADDEFRQFVCRLDCLRSLLDGGNAADFVTAAFLLRASRTWPEPDGFLLRAGQALVPLLSAEPQRLSAILRQMQPEV
jgi:hypothetical protein